MLPLVARPIAPNAPILQEFPAFFDFPVNRSLPSYFDGKRGVVLYESNAVLLGDEAWQSDDAPSLDDVLHHLGGDGYRRISYKAWFEPAYAKLSEARERLMAAKADVDTISEMLCLGCPSEISDGEEDATSPLEDIPFED